MRRVSWGICVALYGFALRAGAQSVQVDPELPPYAPTSGIAGSIKSVGSDTMNNLMTLWAEGFRQQYPNVKIEIEGKGSSTAPPALITGSANFGPMSREMKEAEIDAFAKRYGYKPTMLAVGIDMLAVYVHRDNPLTGVSLPQVDAMFSKNRKLNHPRDVRHWGDLGLEGSWSAAPISMYGRNAASGTYAYFKENALGGGDFKDSVKEQPGSASVVQGVSRDRFGVGYSGIGFRNADVKPLAIAQEAGGKPVAAEPAAALSGDYPLARSLWVAVNYDPNGKLDPLRAEFLRYIFSKEGQQQAVKDGYLPLPAKTASEMLTSVGIEAKAGP